MEKQQPPLYNETTTESVYPTIQTPPLQPPPLLQQQGVPIFNALTNTPYVRPRFGPVPQPTICPHCHSQITSRIQSEPSMRTHLLAVLLCIVCCLPCIPYCMDSCKNRNHYCPSCDSFLGTYEADTMTGRYI